jgi:hypothetical protein
MLFLLVTGLLFTYSFPLLHESPSLETDSLEQGEYQCWVSNILTDGEMKQITRDLTVQKIAFVIHSFQLPNDPGRREFGLPDDSPRKSHHVNRIVIKIAKSDEIYYVDESVEFVSNEGFQKVACKALD